MRLIDADALLDIVEQQGYVTVDDIINTPTIEAEPVKHGRWVHPKGYVVSNGFLCSECNHEEASYHVIHPLGNGSCRADEHGNFYYPPKINYCPNCGAKMDGGADHAD